MIAIEGIYLLPLSYCFCNSVPYEHAIIALGYDPNIIIMMTKIVEFNNNNDDNFSSFQSAPTVRTFGIN